MVCDVLWWFVVFSATHCNSSSIKLVLLSSYSQAKTRDTLLTLISNLSYIRQEISLKDKCRRFVFSLQLFWRNTEGYA